MNHIARFFVVSSLLFVGVFSVFSFVQADEEIVVPTATVIATKIVCPNEANLPDVAFGQPNFQVTEHTVDDFLAVHPNCARQAGWQFQYDTTFSPNPGNNILGEAGAPWVTSALTNEEGETTMVVPLADVSQIHVREVMQNGYIGFTHGDASDNSLGYTAELYCADDAKNYDNFDFVKNPAPGETYHCVAWNAPVRTYPAYCGNGVVDQSWEACDGTLGCTAQCQVAAEQCTENVFAHVIVTNTENIGYGDATDVMWIGGVMQPDWAWFPVKIGGTTVVDPSISGYQDVPGLAIERSTLGIRVRLFGSHTDGSQEHSEGYIEFSSGTTLSSLVSDTGVNAVEHGTDGVKEIASQQDEIWTLGNIGHYWFTVTTQNDGFVATYSPPMCQSEVTDLCSNIEGIQATVPEGMVATDGICAVPSTENSDGNTGNTGGSGSQGGGIPAKCGNGQDDDNDGKADYPQDPGCSSSIDDNETDEVSLLGGGTGLGTTTGDVLGASTNEPALPASCTAYIAGYLKYGKKNDAEEVKKLQEFLNETMGEHIPVSGYFGTLTRDLVKKFQKKYHAEILKPWLDAGWKGKDLENGTGYVYKTTKRWINMMKCASLAIPVPDLSAS